MVPYRRADNNRAIFEIIVTAVPFLALWLLAWLALQESLLLAFMILVPAAGFLVRLFAIQHDCGHGAMFTSQKANDWTGRILGVFTFTPYAYWRHSHALHHASSGNLDRRGFGDIETKTVEEYNAMSGWQQFGYRMYRNPFVMFIIGPAYLFFFKQRLPFEMLGRGWSPWISTIGTNFGIAALFAAGIYLFGAVDFLLLQLTVVFLAGSMGIWLFYVQHQFEETHWERAKEWKREHAALMGSSYYALPKPLMWITANIGIHHVHHLCSHVPYYRLPEIIAEYPVLKTIGRISVRQSLRTVSLALWDEESKRMISFRQLRRMSKPVINPAILEPVLEPMLEPGIEAAE